MNKYTFGFIGAGNMGGALAKAAAKSISDILITDKNSDAGKALAEKLSVDFGSNQDVAQNCKYIFLGVKPQVMAEMLAEIAPVLKERTDDFILVSMAAGLEIATIQEMAQGNYKTIRIMPNTPVEVGMGEILYCKSENTTDEELNFWVKNMSAAGDMTPLSEELMNAGCSVSGCGPAFVYMFIKGLAQGGVECGIDPDVAVKLAAQTVMGSAKLLMESGKDPDTLKQNVCSPGGSTIEGVKSLDADNLGDIVAKAVNASFKRNIEIGKKN